MPGIIAASAWPALAADSRMPAAANRLHRIGVLGPDTTDAQGPLWDAFVEELARRGHVEGRNLLFVRRYAADGRAEPLDALAAEIVAAQVDVIYATRGSASALAAKRATSTIPIVFFSSADPVGMGLVASLARPGGNLTGSAALSYDLTTKAVELLSEATGGVRRFAFFLQAGQRRLPWIQKLEATLAEAAARFGARVHFVEVTAAHEIDRLVRGLRGQGCDSAIVYDFAVIQPHLQRIATLCIEQRLPAYGWAHWGFLLHYSEPRWEMARTAARLVDRILRGAKPAELPVEQVSTFDLTLNLKTARALGLTLPRALLARANEVIE